MKAWDYGLLLQRAADDRGIVSAHPYYIFDCLDAEPEWWTWPTDECDVCDEFCEVCADRCIEHAAQSLGLPVCEVFDRYGKALRPFPALDDSDRTAPCPLCGAHLDRSLTDEAIKDELNHFEDYGFTDDRELPYVIALCDAFGDSTDDLEYGRVVALAQRACRELNVPIPEAAHS